MEQDRAARDPSPEEVAADARAVKAAAARVEGRDAGRALTRAKGPSPEERREDGKHVLE